MRLFDRELGVEFKVNRVVLTHLDKFRLRTIAPLGGQTADGLVEIRRLNLQFDFEMFSLNKRFLFKIGMLCFTDLGSPKSCRCFLFHVSDCRSSQKIALSKRSLFARIFKIYSPHILIFPLIPKIWLKI